MIKELIERFGIKINSSAKTIEDALADGTNAAFSKLKIERDGMKYREDDFERIITSDEARKLFKLEGDSVEVLREVLKQIAKEKRELKAKVDADRMMKAAEMKGGTNINQRKGVTYGQPMTLFAETPMLGTNGADSDFFSRFRTTDDGQLLYKDLNGKLHFLFTSPKGIDFKNELRAYGEDNLWTMLTKDIGVKYVDYCRLAKVAWTKADEETNLEEIFTGMDIEIDEETAGKYCIPTFFRHLIAPVPVYTKSTDTTPSYFSRIYDKSSERRYGF